MATLQQLPTTFLMQVLFSNPTAQSFPWSVQGISGSPSRAQLLNELANRSGEGDSSQIIGDVGTTTTGSKKANGKTEIR
jgi:hypothetical protein